MNINTTAHGHVMCTCPGQFRLSLVSLSTRNKAVLIRPARRTTHMHAEGWQLRVCKSQAGVGVPRAPRSVATCRAHVLRIAQLRYPPISRPVFLLSLCPLLNQGGAHRVSSGSSDVSFSCSLCCLKILNSISIAQELLQKQNTRPMFTSTVKARLGQS